MREERRVTNSCSSSPKFSPNHDIKLVIRVAKKSHNLQ